MSEPPTLYPEIQPFHSAHLDVGDGHRIRYEQCGNPDGLPVLFLHGGPASGFAPRQRRFFDPELYHIIMFDQRGSGASTPAGERAHNTTDHLLTDINLLRETLGLSQWLLFGGSWGSALALAWAARYPQYSLGLILRGVFLTGQADMDWFFRDAGNLMPDAWHAFATQVGGSPLPADTPNLLGAYSRAIENPEQAASACASWMAWEASLTRPGGAPQKAIAGAQVSAATIDKYRLQAAYLNRLCDLGEEAVLQAARRVALLPTAIVHGRLDWVCRARNAWKIHQLMPGSRLRLIDHAGHDPYSTQMVASLVEATNCFVKQKNFSTLGSEWIG